MIYVQMIRPSGLRVHQGVMLACRQQKMVARQVVMAAQAQYQKDLSRVEKKELRSLSVRLGPRLVVVQIGKNGVSQNTLEAISDALAKNELIKLKLGGGCEDPLEDVISQVTRGCDAVKVHSVGFTALVYRNKDLPRIAPKLIPVEGGAEEEEEEEAEEEEEEAAVEAPEAPQRDRTAAASTSAPKAAARAAPLKQVAVEAEVEAEEEDEEEEEQGAEGREGEGEGEDEEGEDGEPGATSAAAALNDEDSDYRIDDEDLQYFKLDEEDPRLAAVRARLAAQAAQEKAGTAAARKPRKPPVFEVIAPPKPQI